MKTQIEEVTIRTLFKTTSIAGWVLLIRPIIYLLFSRRRDLNAYSAIDFSAIIFILYAFVACIIGYKVIFQSNSDLGKRILRNSPITWFLAYTFLCLVSMLWSINPFLTGFRAFECIANALLIVAVIQRLFETGSLKYVILWSVFFCTWDIIWSIGGNLVWTTDIFQLLQSSQMMATSFFFMALYFVPRRWYNYLIIVMSLFSMSTVAYIGMAMGAISAFWMRGKAKIIAILVGYAIIIAIIMVGPYQLLKETIFFDKQEITIKETSGRDHLMKVSLNCVEKHPYGLGFFAAEPYVLYSQHLGAISTHNSIFSAALGVGIPGVILISIFFVSLWVIVFSNFIPLKYKPIMIGCFCVAFLHCMGNPSIGTRVFGAWIPCMYIFVLISGCFICRKYYDNEIDSE